MLTRFGQYMSLLLRFKNTTYYKVTHTELILDENEDGSVTIASASVRDGGVRTKRNVFLTKENWIIHETKWDAEKARAWFIEHDGAPYDWRGAGVSWLPVLWSIDGHYFCSQADSAAVGLPHPETIKPSDFAEIVMSS